MASPLVVVALFLLPQRAHATPMDQFSVVGNGLDIEFSLAASYTEPIISTQFSPPGPITGTVNGAPSTIRLNLLFPGSCAGCGTIYLQENSQTLFIGLPDFYQIANEMPYTDTITFLPGSYPTFTQFTPDGPKYTITIAPQTTAATPEPSTLCLVGTATLISGCALRRRLVR